MADKRPVYLNLFKIRLPATGIVSFAHRVSGFLLFLAIPFSIYMLNLSVSSVAGFEQGMRLLQQPVLQLLLLVAVWALVHHFLAGIRYLLLDFDIGVDKAGSSISARAVLIIEVLIMALYLFRIML
ncbi:MAG: succinate dehydrogenase, cytochrome b556 subunit [Gammaproteobacteria bacterium]